jgi:hypothetical protein
MKRAFLTTISAIALMTSSAFAQDKAYSPYVGRDFPNSVYFGDTHLHTNISLDSYGDGNRTLGPREAYGFAKGQETKGHDGKLVRISRPLDFLMVADHAEYLGIVKGIANGDKGLRGTKTGAAWGKLMDEDKWGEVFGEFIIDVTSNKPRIKSPEFTKTVWDDIIAAAEENNEPGKFTALIGYEFSPFPDGDNLHRVVVFRDDADKTGQVVPFSAFDSNNPEDLWAYLAAYEKKTGGQVLAIPHNANLSNGRLFALQTFEGNPLTREYAKTRMRWEPLYEVTQMKGDSETHPVVSPKDPFADFESWDRANLAMLKKSTPEVKPFEYARPALKNGLAQAAAIGVNPFKFGMIGSTDSHTSYSSAEEDNYLGKYAIGTPSPDRWKKIMAEGVPDRVTDVLEWETSMSGLAGVWATENTREAIWDAMKRKEVYATTGPRMTVRMFGGWDFKAADAFRNDLPAIGYKKGVPMGGDLTAAPKGKAPSFLVAAMRDPDGANLDRIQMVKGWLDAKGAVHERVYDVAVSDGRKIFKGKAIKKVGTTVDLKSATYANSIGDTYLSATWSDPDFDPALSAFYYLRVIEIPTPRWTAYDEVRFKIKMPKEVTRVLQERAYTSPIWYTPKG